MPSLTGASGWPLHRIAFTESAARHLAEGGQIPGGDIHPWLVAQLRERLDHAPEHGFTISRVRAMSTEAIVAELARHGLDVDAVSFSESAADFDSAWELSDSWAERAAAASREFLGLAACELWRRWLPERPGVELLDERMQTGYDALDTGDGARAARLWLGWWADLLGCLPQDVRTFEDADEWFPGLNSLGNWIGDFEVELHNASLRDPALGREGLALYERLVARFDPSPERHSLRRRLAEYALRCGDPGRSESILRSLIGEAPDDAGAYALLSEQLCQRGNLAGAREVLEAALRRPVHNAAGWGLADRLRDVGKFRKRR